MRSVLSIAGSDSIGGAGIQADIKTISFLGKYAMTAITAVTAQNTMGVSGAAVMDPSFVAEQIDRVFDDIRPDSVKIGMIPNGAVARAVAERLVEHRAQNIVLDPVMVATSSARLMDEGAVGDLKSALMPIASVITPNITEAEVLSGREIADRRDMEAAAREISSWYGGAILIKGGHLPDSADDLLWHDGEARWIEGRRVDNPNTHGTGCTLSSAVACGLADGLSLVESVVCAKRYITGAISAMLDIGRGRGPLDHMWELRRGR